MPEHSPVEEIFDGIKETINDHLPKHRSVRFLEEDKSPISAQMNKLFGRQEENPVSAQMNKLFGRPEENPVSAQMNKLFGRQEENPVSAQMNKLFGRQEENPVSAQMNKLLGRQKTIHGVFGGGKSADVLLWRNKKVSSSIIVAATAIWVLFEWLEYHFLTLACFSLVIGMVIQFVWSNASYLMNSPPSSVPRLVLPQDLFANVGASVGTEVYQFLCFLQDVASGKDLKQFVLVVGGLWAAAVIGSFCNFVTVIYIGFLVAHILPVFYEKYEDEVDGLVDNLLGNLKKQYNKIDQGVLRKIPKGNLKPKKID